MTSGAAAPTPTASGPVGTYSAVTPSTGTPPAGELKTVKSRSAGDPWEVPADNDAVGDSDEATGRRAFPAPAAGGGGPRRGPTPRAGGGAPSGACEDYGHRVFVGGLPVCRPEMDETALAAQFAHIDAIKDVVIMRNRATGQSKGFGFITFASRVGQQRAMAEMDGQSLVGPDGTRRKCSVNPAVRPPFPRSPFPPHEGKLVTDHNCLQEPRVRPLKRGPTDRIYAPRGPGPGRGGHGNAGRREGNGYGGPPGDQDRYSGRDERRPPPRDAYYDQGPPPPPARAQQQVELQSLQSKLEDAAFRAEAAEERAKGLEQQLRESRAETQAVERQLTRILLQAAPGRERLVIQAPPRYERPPPPARAAYYDFPADSGGYEGSPKANGGPPPQYDDGRYGRGSPGALPWGARPVVLGL